MVTLTMVPRALGESRNSTRPLFCTRASSTELQAMTSPGTSSVIIESHSKSVPAGPRTFQCDRLPSRMVTLSMFSMNSGRLRKSRQKSYSSWRERLMLTVRPTSSWASSSTSSPDARASGFFAVESGASAARVCVVRSAMVAYSLITRRAGLGHLAMLLGQHGVGHQVGERRTQLVGRARDHAGLALLHGLEAGLRHVGGIRLLFRAHLGVEHVGTREEVGVGGPRHQAGDRDARVLELVTQRVRERIDEGLGAVVHGLERAGHVARNRTGDQDLAGVLAAHLFRDALDEIDGARDVGVDHVLHLGEFLVEE